MMNISEDVFWNIDIPILERIVESKSAYDKWYSAAIQKESERHGR